MGMFTRILHPKTGEEIQIKTGDDFLDTYKVGDKVDRHINKNVYDSGCCWDGAYDGWKSKGEKCIVIINNQIVENVIDVKYEDEEDFWETYRNYLEKYPEQKTDESLYNKEAIEKHYKWKKEWDEKQKIEDEKDELYKNKLIEEHGEEEGLLKFIGYLLSKQIKKWWYDRNYTV